MKTKQYYAINNPQNIGTFISSMRSISESTDNNGMFYVVYVNSLLYVYFIIIFDDHINVYAWRFNSKAAKWKNIFLIKY